MSDAAEDFGGEEISTEGQTIESAGLTEPLGAESPPEGTTDWKAPFGDDPAVSNFKSPQDFAKSYSEAQRMIRSSIRIPGEDAGDEAMNAFYEKLEQVPGVYRYDPDNPDTVFQKLGVPESPEGYQFSDIEGFQSDREDDARFAKLAHELRMTPQQADGMRKALGGQLAEADAMQQQYIEQGINELKQEWGLAFDQQTEAARGAVSMIDQQVPGFAEWLNQGAGNEAMLIKAMAVVAQMGGEAQAMPEGTAPGMLTPADALIKINEIRNNPAHPYNNDGDPAHQAAVDKMTKLYEFAHPDR